MVIASTGWVPGRSASPAESLKRRLFRLWLDIPDRWSSDRRTIALPTPRLRDQGEGFPCCMSIAMAAGMERVSGMIGLSPMFHYYYAMQHGGGPEGMDFGTALGVLGDYGMCAEAFYGDGPMPYSAERVRHEPDDAARQDAGRRRLKVRYQPEKDDPRRYWFNTLAAGYCVLLGFTTTEAYVRLVDAGPDYVLSDPGGPAYGGHAVVVYGYDAGTDLFKIADCRGAHRFQNGSWYLPGAAILRLPEYDAWALCTLQE